MAVVAVASSFPVMGAPAAESAAGNAPPGGNDAVSIQDLPDPASSLATSNGAAEPEHPGRVRNRWIVVIDPGHGGGDSGEEGVNGIGEGDLMLQVAQATEEQLAGSCEVFLTRRSNETTLSAEQRAGDANYRRADVFVSLHAGASSSPSANGIEVFIPTGTTTTAAGRTISARGDASNQERNQKLAQHLLTSIHATTSATARGIYRAPCRVFNGLTMPAALVEIGFLTNPLEADLLAGDEYQRTIAEGIAGGIRAFLSSSN